MLCIHFMKFSHSDCKKLGQCASVADYALNTLLEGQTCSALGRKIG